MRPYAFKLDEGYILHYSRYIYMVDLRCTNHLLGRISYATRNDDYRWYIEYFEDCLEECKDLPGFCNISGCDFERFGLVFRYTNCIPFFVYERLISRKRPDFYEYLASIGLKEMIFPEYFDAIYGVSLNKRFYMSSRDDDLDFYHPTLHWWHQPEEYKVKKDTEIFKFSKE